MKPLINYYGGKQRIAQRIVDVICTIPHSVYCEPFFGGGAVLFKKGFPAVSNTDNYREVINDYSEQLMTMYRYARSHPKEFERLIKATPYSRSDYELAARILKSKKASKKAIAWAYYYNVQTSFASILHGGWGTNVFGLNQAERFLKKSENLKQCLQRLFVTIIDCQDYQKVIDRWDSPQTLFYLDPPYPNTGQGHYSGYTEDDHTRLCDLLDNCQSSYILSNYAQKYEPKSAQIKKSFDTHCTASGKGKVGKNRDKTRTTTKKELGNTKRQEILWICDRSKNARKSLQPVMQKNIELLRSRTLKHELPDPVEIICEAFAKTNAKVRKPYRTFGRCD